MGVTPFYKAFERNGMPSPNLAIVYSDRGYGVGGPVVAGVRWFHSGGIFAADYTRIGDSGLVIQGMQRGKDLGRGGFVRSESEFP
jgi:hypothetical protein